MAKSERLEVLTDAVKGAQIAEKIDTDPFEAALFNRYAESLGNHKRDYLRELLRKRKDGTGHTATENKEWDAHMVTIFHRKQQGERVIANLNDKDVEQLAEILGETVNSVDREKLPLHILGLAVANTDEFAPLAARIRKWKGSARDDRNEKEAVYWKGIADKLAARYDISPEEMKRFAKVEGGRERYKEINRAIRTSGWLKTVFDIARQRHLGTRAGGLNYVVAEYRAASSDLRMNLVETLKVLRTVDTTKDWLKGIDEAFLKSKAQALAEKDRPLTVAQVREKLTPEAAKKGFEAHLAGINGGKALKDFEGHRATRVAASTPADVWTDSVDVGGGTMRTVNDLYNDYTSGVHSQIKSQGLMSSVLWIIFGDFIVPKLNDAKTYIQS